MVSFDEAQRKIREFQNAAGPDQNYTLLECPACEHETVFYPDPESRDEVHCLECEETFEVKFCAIDNEPHLSGTYCPYCADKMNFQMQD